MVLSGTIVNVAVPDVMGAFGVGQSEVQLMSTAFMISMTTGQLLNAWVVAVFGQRWGYMGTLALFTLGSLVAGAAESGLAVGTNQGLVGMHGPGHPGHHQERQRRRHGGGI